MSYTGVVFSSRVARNVDRDALEKKRIDDRGKPETNSVGFEARFQTAGSLIFQPQRGSSLFVDGTAIQSTQTSSGSIRTMNRTTVLLDKNSAERWTTSMKSERKGGCRSTSNAGTSMKKVTIMPRRSDFIIKRCSWRINAIPTGSPFV